MNIKNKEKKMKIKLGVTARDTITGFVGIVTGYASYLTGCDQYCLAPKVDKEGKHVESRWFDVNRVVVTKGSLIELDTEDDKGACDPAPLY